VSLLIDKIWFKWSFKTKVIKQKKIRSLRSLIQELKQIQFVGLFYEEGCKTGIQREAETKLRLCGVTSS